MGSSESVVYRRNRDFNVSNNAKKIIVYSSSASFTFENTPSNIDSMVFYDYSRNYIMKGGNSDTVIKSLYVAYNKIEFKEFKPLIKNYSVMSYIPENARIENLTIYMPERKVLKSDTIKSIDITGRYLEIDCPNLELLTITNKEYCNPDITLIRSKLVKITGSIIKIINEQPSCEIYNGEEINEELLSKLPNLKKLKVEKINLDGYYQLDKLKIPVSEIDNALDHIDCDKLVIDMEYMEFKDVITYTQNLDKFKGNIKIINIIYPNISKIFRYRPRAASIFHLYNRNYREFDQMALRPSHSKSARNLVR